MKMLVGAKPEVPRPSEAVYREVHMGRGLSTALVVIGVVMVLAAAVTAAVLVSPSFSSPMDLVQFVISGDRTHFALAFLAAVVPPLLLLAWILRTDKYEPEPKRIVLLVYAMGAVVGLAAAPMVIYGKGSTYWPLLAPLILGSLIVGSLTIFATSKYGNEVNDHVDGFVYGASLGAGLSLIYAVVSFLDAQIDPLANIALLDLPASGLVVSSVFWSVIFIMVGGLAGFWLGYERTLDGEINGRDAVPAFLVTVVVLYIAYVAANMGGIIDMAVRGSLSLYLIAISRRLLIEALKDEVACGYTRGMAPRE